MTPHPYKNKSKLFVTFVRIKIADLIKEKDTEKVVSNATVIAGIYNLRGIKIFSINMREKIQNSGIYEVESPDNILKMKLNKGIYLVHTKASYGSEPVARDMIQFHVDPQLERLVSYLYLKN